MQWRWARAHGSIGITGEGGALATRNGWGGVGYRPAVCGEVLRAEGEAYAEFTWVSGRLMVGVARAGVDPSSMSEGLHRTADGWMYACWHGNYYHNGSSTPWASGTKQGIAEGETVGLLLQRGSLHVYLKGRRAGTLVSGLSGQLVWAADLYRQGASVRIARKPTPK